MFENFTLTDRSVFAIAAAMYGAGFFYGCRILRTDRPYSRTVMFSLLLGGFLMQTLGLNLRGTAVRACPLGNPFEIAQFLGWSLILLFLIIGPAFRLRFLGFFTAGLSTLLTAGAFLVPAWDYVYVSKTTGENAWIELHAALALFSYGIFGLLSLVSIMFLIQEQGLKKKQFKQIYQFLPSVQQLDLMAKRLLIGGLLLLSASLIFGAVFWVKDFERVPVFKLTATCLVWLGYLTIFTLRIRKKLINRRHAIASIGLFIFAMASLWPIQSLRSMKLPPTGAALTSQVPVAAPSR